MNRAMNNKTVNAVNEKSTNEIISCVGTNCVFQDLPVHVLYSTLCSTHHTRHLGRRVPSSVQRELRFLKFSCRTGAGQLQDRSRT